MSSSTGSSRPRRWHAGRIVAIVLALLLAALVGIIWVLPGMLDWNQYRSSIAALVAAGIGRPVSIDGNITLTLLPQPILTATGLKVNDAGDGVIMTARELRLRVALGPLLAGRVDARELTLRNADLHLPWPPPKGALTRRPPAWLTGLQARIEASRLQVGNLVASDLDASLGSDPETGTLSAAGSAKIFGYAWNVTTHLGRPGRDSAAPLDISLDGQDKLRDTGGTFSGILGADGALFGRIAARGPDLSRIMPAPAVPWRGDGRLSASGGLAIADELALEIGGSPATGAVALRVQPDLRLDLALSAGRLDLNAWVPVLLRTAQPGMEPALPTGIDLTAEAASLAGGTLRQLRSAFDIDAKGVTLREANAMLPGGAKLTLQGHVARSAAAAAAATFAPVFEGTASLIAPDLPATLRWIEPLAPSLLHDLPNQALRTADLSAKVTAEPKQLSFLDINGRLNGAVAQGGLAIRFGKRLGISASLAMDRALLDPWLPNPASLTSPTSDYARINGLIAARPFDADIKLQLRKAIWAGADFGPLSLDAQSEAGRFTLRRLEATAFGMHATLSGTMGEGGRLSEGRLELSTQDVDTMAALLPPDIRLPPALLRGPASALVQVSGPPEALGVRATLELGDLRIEAQPVVNVHTHRWTGPFTLHHPGAPRLLERLDLPGTASWLGDGSFSLIAQATLVPGRVDLANIEMVAGALRAGGQLSLAGRDLTGRIRAETLPLPGFYPRSPDPLPLDSLRADSADLHLEAGEVLSNLAPIVQHFAGDLKLARQTLSLTNASATLSGGPLSGGSVTGSATLDFSDKPSLALTTHMTGVAIQSPLGGGTLDLAGGALRAEIQLKAEGFSPAAMTATLTGTGKIDVTNAKLTGIDLGRARALLNDPAERTKLDADLQQTLQTGTTPLATLTAPFTAQRGVLTIQAKGDNPDGAVTFDGTADLLGDNIEGRLALRPAGDLPEVAARLTGPITAPARTPELAAVARWLADRP